MKAGDCGVDVTAKAVSTILLGLILLKFIANFEK